MLNQSDRGKLQLSSHGALRHENGQIVYKIAFAGIMAILIRNGILALYRDIKEQD